MRCAACKKDKAKVKMPFNRDVVILCWNCAHEVRKSIMGLLDGIENLISEDIVIKSIAMQLYQKHQHELEQNLCRGNNNNDDDRTMNNNNK